MRSFLFYVIFFKMKKYLLSLLVFTLFGCFGYQKLSSQSLLDERGKDFKRGEDVSYLSYNELSFNKKRSSFFKASSLKNLGSCPCPYSRDKAGKRCGGRSAWSKSGGKKVQCYEEDGSRRYAPI